MINFNALTKTQKLAIFSFGEPDRLATETNLLVASAMVDKPRVSTLIAVLIELLESDDMTDEDFKQLFWNIRKEFTSRMSRYEELHLQMTGDLCEDYAWAKMAKQMFLGYFGHDKAKFTMKRLAFVEKAMPDPELGKIVHELMSDISMMMVFHPGDYSGTLRKARKFLEFCETKEQGEEPEM